MNRIKLISIFVFLSLMVSGQNRKTKSLLKIANYELNNLRYTYSIPYYKKYLLLQPNDTLALKNIATAYQMVNQFDSALKYLEKAVENGHKSITQLPELYAVLKKYDKAINYYISLPDSVKTMIIDSRVYGFRNLKRFYSDSIDFTIFNTIINTPYNDYNATPYNGGLVFESNRLPKVKIKSYFFNIFKKNEFAWDGAGYSKLYFTPNTNIRTNNISSYIWNDKKLPRTNVDYTVQTSNDNNKFSSGYDINPLKYNDSTVKLFNLQVGVRYNIGSVSFTKDGLHAYFTKNQSKSKGVFQLEIWESIFINGHWSRGHKMFFNNSNYSYFHPAISQDGKRLYYVSDEPTGFGGSDLYYIEKNSDGSWKATTNLGPEVNTEGNELFPTFYDGLFCFSSNGHPGLGGLDIFRIESSSKGEMVIKNLGYPINSSFDDIAFYMNNYAGFFTSNRYGSDDILAFDYKKVQIQLKGQILTDQKLMEHTKVYLYAFNDQGNKYLVDSTFLDVQSNYTFNTRPNSEYSIELYDTFGNIHEFSINSENYINQNGVYNKDIALLNIPIPEQQLIANKEKEDEIRKAELAKLTPTFIRAIDSLKSLTNDYVELHHPFDQVYIIKKDLNEYYKLIERVKRMNGKKIVIVSATDCNGTYEYNEDLSIRRAKRISKSLAKLSNNILIIKQVGERELLKDCSDARKDILEQVVNRYSYIFILNK